MEGQNCNCGLGRILNLITKLQKTTRCESTLDNSCIRPYLGTPANLECYNTRPITFYGCDNNLINIEYTAITDGVVETLTSNIFRIERVQDCTAVVTILRENPDTSATNRPYITTNQTATINLNCICAIKCLADTIVDL